MPHASDLTRRRLGRSAAALLAAALAPRVADAAPRFSVADVGDGVSLHYVETGAGEPVVFAHGSLSDLSYWSGQLGPFAAAGRRALAYSRRYNWPNHNPAQPGYSAVVDAMDLARLIEVRAMGPAHVVGHSYGALTGLFLASQRPELVRTLTLAEPPAVSLLKAAPGSKAALGAAMFADIQRFMVGPMRAAFAAGKTEAGIAFFIDYVLGDPRAWNRFSASARRETLRNAHEWEVMMTKGELFPPLTPDAVRAIRAPALLLSGGKSYPFLGLIDEALVDLLPNNHRIVFPNATHQMWLQEPQKCRDAVLALQAGRSLP
jgi:pimeloyl-ACP methyl ester carboxylesterase